MDALNIKQGDGIYGGRGENLETLGRPAVHAAMTSRALLFDELLLRVLYNYYDSKPGSRTVAKNYCASFMIVARAPSATTTRAPRRTVRRKPCVSILL